MNISSIIYGGSFDNRFSKITELVPNFKWENNPDLKIIERIKTKKSIGIEEVRPISGFLKIKPLGQKKIVIIKEANLLTTEAQNSLLKILEEPPVYSQIFLESETIENLLPTILSRCQKIKVGEMPEDSTTFEVNFLDLPLGERFDYCETLSKLEKDEVISYLTWVLKTYNNSEKKEKIENLNLLLTTIENLSKFNLNTRLALENLAVNFNNN